MSASLYGALQVGLQAAHYEKQCAAEREKILRAIDSPATYSKDRLVLKFAITDEEHVSLVRNFPEINILPPGPIHNLTGHDVASAVRQCINHLVADRYSSGTVKDVGGNPLYHFQRENTHCCCPILDTYDNARRVGRVTTARKMKKEFTKGVKLVDLDKIDSILSVLDGNQVTTAPVCRNKAQKCNIPADVVTFIDSAYDINPEDAFEIAAKAGARVFVVALIEPTALILGASHGYDPDLKVRYGYKHMANNTTIMLDESSIADMRAFENFFKVKETNGDLANPVKGKLDSPIRFVFNDGTIYEHKPSFLRWFTIPTDGDISKGTNNWQYHKESQKRLGYQLMTFTIADKPLPLSYKPPVLPASLDRVLVIINWPVCAGNGVWTAARIGIWVASGAWSTATTYVKENVKPTDCVDKVLRLLRSLLQRIIVHGSQVKSRNDFNEDIIAPLATAVFLAANKDQELISWSVDGLRIVTPDNLCYRWFRCCGKPELEIPEYVKNLTLLAQNDGWGAKVVPAQHPVILTPSVIGALANIRAVSKISVRSATWSEKSRETVPEEGMDAELVDAIVEHIGAEVYVNKGMILNPDEEVKDQNAPVIPDLDHISLGTTIGSTGDTASLPTVIEVEQVDPTVQEKSQMDTDPYKMLEEEDRVFIKDCDLDKTSMTLHEGVFIYTKIPTSRWGNIDVHTTTLTQLARHVKFTRQDDGYVVIESAKIPEQTLVELGMTAYDVMAVENTKTPPRRFGLPTDPSYGASVEYLATQNKSTLKSIQSGLQSITTAIVTKISGQQTTTTSLSKDYEKVDTWDRVGQWEATVSQQPPWRQGRPIDDLYESDHEKTNLLNGVSFANLNFDLESKVSSKIQDVESASNQGHLVSIEAVVEPSAPPESQVVTPPTTDYYEDRLNLSDVESVQTDTPFLPQEIEMQSLSKNQNDELALSEVESVISDTPFIRRTIDRLPESTEDVPKAPPPKQKLLAPYQAKYGNLAYDSEFSEEETYLTPESEFHVPKSTKVEPKTIVQNSNYKMIEYHEQVTKEVPEFTYPGQEHRCEDCNAVMKQSELCDCGARHCFSCLTTKYKKSVSYCPKCSPPSPESSDTESESSSASTISTETVPKKVLETTKTQKEPMITETSFTNEPTKEPDQLTKLEKFDNQSVKSEESSKSKILEEDVMDDYTATSKQMVDLQAGEMKLYPLATNHSANSNRTYPDRLPEWLENMEEASIGHLIGDFKVVECKYAPSVVCASLKCRQHKGYTTSALKSFYVKCNLPNKYALEMNEYLTVTLIKYNDIIRTIRREVNTFDTTILKGRYGTRSNPPDLQDEERLAEFATHVVKDGKIVLKSSVDENDKVFFHPQLCPFYEYMELTGIHGTLLIDEFAPRFSLVEGVPGCGKTRMLYKVMDPDNHLVVTATRATSDQLNDWYRKKGGTWRVARTAASRLILPAKDVRQSILCDEFLMLHAGMVNLIAHKHRIPNIVGFGDRQQIPWVCRIGIITENSMVANEPIAVQTVSHRVPRSIIPYLKGNHPQMETASLLPGSIQTILLGSRASIPIDHTAKYLTYTHYDKKAIKSFDDQLDVSTVGESQGETFRKVIFVRFGTGMVPIFNFYEGKPNSWMFVGMTRHTETFVYCTLKHDDPLYKFLSRRLEIPGASVDNSAKVEGMIRGILDLKGKGKDLKFNIHRDLRVFFDIEADALVNPANCALSNGGGLAAKIAQRGGKKYRDQCVAYIKEHKLMETHFTSGPGDIKNVKKIVHIVGPTAGSKHVDREFDDMYSEVRAAMILGDLKSIIIPAVSTGLFGVAQSKYHEATVRFIDSMNDTCPEGEFNIVLPPSFDVSLYKDKQNVTVFPIPEGAEDFEKRINDQQNERIQKRKNKEKVSYVAKPSDVVQLVKKKYESLNIDYSKETTTEETTTEEVKTEVLTKIDVPRYLLEQANTVADKKKEPESKPKKKRKRRQKKKKESQDQQLNESDFETVSNSSGGSTKTKGEMVQSEQPVKLPIQTEQKQTSVETEPVEEPVKTEQVTKVPVQSEVTVDKEEVKHLEIAVLPDLESFMDKKEKKVTTHINSSTTRYSTHEFQTDELLVFSGGTHPFSTYHLANFTELRNGNFVTFRSVEHYIAFEKSVIFDLGREQQILEAKSAKRAHEIAATVSLRPGDLKYWVGIQSDLIGRAQMLRVIQIEDVCVRLLESGARKLIDGSPDKVIGSGKWLDQLVKDDFKFSGQNHNGRILGLLRAQILLTRSFGKPKMKTIEAPRAPTPEPVVEEPEQQETLEEEPVVEAVVHQEPPAQLPKPVGNLAIFEHGKTPEKSNSDTDSKQITSDSDTSDDSDADDEDTMSHVSSKTDLSEVSNTISVVSLTPLPKVFINSKDIDLVSSTIRQGAVLTPEVGQEGYYINLQMLSGQITYEEDGDTYIVAEDTSINPAAITSIKGREPQMRHLAKTVEDKHVPTTLHYDGQQLKMALTRVNLVPLSFLPIDSIFVHRKPVRGRRTTVLNSFRPTIKGMKKLKSFVDQKYKKDVKITVDWTEQTNSEIVTLLAYLPNKISEFNVMTDLEVLDLTEGEDKELREKHYAKHDCVCVRKAVVEYPEMADEDAERLDIPNELSERTVSNSIHGLGKKLYIVFPLRGDSDQARMMTNQVVRLLSYARHHDVTIQCVGFPEQVKGSFLALDQSKTSMDLARTLSDSCWLVTALSYLEYHFSMHFTKDETMQFYKRFYSSEGVDATIVVKTILQMYKGIHVVYRKVNFDGVMVYTVDGSGHWEFSKNKTEGFRHQLEVGHISDLKNLFNYLRQDYHTNLPKANGRVVEKIKELNLGQEYIDLCPLPGHSTRDALARGIKVTPVIHLGPGCLTQGRIKMDPRPQVCKGLVPFCTCLSQSDGKGKVILLDIAKDGTNTAHDQYEANCDCVETIIDKAQNMAARVVIKTFAHPRLAEKLATVRRDYKIVRCNNSGPFSSECYIDFGTRGMSVTIYDILVECCANFLDAISRTNGVVRRYYGTQVGPLTSDTFAPENFKNVKTNTKVYPDLKTAWKIALPFSTRDIKYCIFDSAPAFTCFHPKLEGQTDGNPEYLELMLRGFKISNLCVMEDNGVLRKLPAGVYSHILNSRRVIGPTSLMKTGLTNSSAPTDLIKLKSCCAKLHSIGVAPSLAIISAYMYGTGFQAFVDIYLDKFGLKSKYRATTTGVLDFRFSTHKDGTTCDSICVDESVISTWFCPARRPKNKVCGKVYDIPPDVAYSVGVTIIRQGRGITSLLRPAYHATMKASYEGLISKEVLREFPLTEEGSVARELVDRQFGESQHVCRPDPIEHFYVSPADENPHDGFKPTGVLNVGLFQTYIDEYFPGNGFSMDNHFDSYHQELDDIEITAPNISLTPSKLFSPPTEVEVNEPELKTGVTLPYPRTAHPLLAGIEKRNVNPPVFVNDMDHEDAAQMMVDNFLEFMCVDNVREILKEYQENPISVSWEDSNLWLRKAAESFKVDKLKRSLDDNEFLTTAAKDLPINLYDVQLKTKPKVLPDVSVQSTTQIGQTVVSNHTMVTFQFSPMVQQLQKRIERVLRPQVVVVASRSATDVAAAMNQVLKEIEDFAAKDLVEIDISKCDKSQLQRLHSAKMLIYLLFGMDPVLAFIFALGHVHTIVVNRRTGTIVKIDYEHKTGDPTTLIGNWLSVMVAYATAFLCVPRFYAGIGDDTLALPDRWEHEGGTRFAPMKFTVEQFSDIANFEAKWLKTGDSTYFCGHFVLCHALTGRWMMVKDPIKILFRLGRPSNSSLDTMVEQYTSLCDELRGMADPVVQLELSMMVDERYAGNISSLALIQGLQELTVSIDVYAQLWEVSRLPSSIDRFVRRLRWASIEAGKKIKSLYYALVRKQNPPKRDEQISIHYVDEYNAAWMESLDD